MASRQGAYSKDDVAPAGHLRERAATLKAVVWHRPQKLVLVLGGTMLLIFASAAPIEGRPSQAVKGSDTYFGSLVGSDALENFPIGGPRRGVFAYRFRSQWTGAVKAVRFFAILNTDERSGYSGGTGGMFRVELTADAGGKRHVPGRTVLASADYTPSRENLFPRLQFPTPARVRRGGYYYLVFTNPDPDPVQNYASVDTLFLERREGVRPPPLPSDVSVLWAYPSSGAESPIRWQADRFNSGSDYLPVVDVVGGAPGQHVGFGYMEVWSDNPKPIGGAAGVRERFIYNRSRAARVAGASIRVRRTSDIAPPLHIRLETLSGQVIATATVPASHVPSSSPGWVVTSFAEPPSVRPGQVLALILTADSDGAYEAFPIRDGSMFGFGNATVFPSGYAQFGNGASWTGWDQWGQPDRHDGDLQFALRLVP